VSTCPIPEAMFDPADPAFLADPYPVFARLRAGGELHRHPTLGRNGEELLVAVSHRVSSAVLRHRAMGRVWSDVAPAGTFGAGCGRVLPPALLGERLGDRS